VTARVKCVLFDLDGTLVDTAPDLGYAADLVRADAGLPPLPVERYRPVASSGARGLLRVALGLEPDHPDYPERRERFLAYYRAHLARSSRLFPGLDELLQGFERDEIRWGVVTNKPSWLTRPLLAELDLARRMACIVSADDVPRAKPAPDSLLLACAQTGFTPQECLYVGDDKRDITAGRAAGMRTVGVEWGYLGEDGPIESWGADAIVETPGDLAALVARGASAR
jgi:2-phosphoglycolate phosphatase